MQNELKKARPDYESECRRLFEENEMLKCKLELLNGDFETLQLDNRSLENERNGLNLMVEDANREIAHLKGQVKAYEFCVSKGK